MYNTDLIKEPTFDELISKVTEYDIYKQYIGYDFKLNQIMSSPLREDKHPSFGVYKSKNGCLMFKDQATGESGNCVKFVSVMFNITYSAALKKIWREIVLNRIIKTEKGKQIKEYSPSTNIILVEKRNFTKRDDEYWSQFEITREDLKEYNIYPINKFWINDILQPYFYTKECPMYAYSIFNKFKIYRPLADKSEKWRTNASIYDIQGYEQLPDKVNTIIITKSLKDIIVLRKLGYYAIAPNSENHTVPKIVIEKLRKDKEVKQFFILYDNDKSGVEAAIKLSVKYNFYADWLPLESNCKDISDYVKEHGLKKAKEWLNEQLIGVK